ncbi:MAG: SOS response-associated peptidase family protein, partial [Cyanobacteria bacterium REEB65]|nr:SOS response-associated peptidase family protein [Cyanobacteria bacterium REEB65]
TEPNKLVAAIHDRMPAILPAAKYETWLSPKNRDPAVVLAAVGPYPESEMKATPVSTRVNSPAFDDPACVEPIAEQMGFGTDKADVP